MALMNKMPPIHPRYWILHKRDEGVELMVVRGHSLEHARLKAGLDGLEGYYVQGHQLDAKISKKMPEALIGQVLNQKKAAALLRTLA